MGTLGNIVIAVSFVTLAGAGASLLYKRKVDRVLAVFGMMSLALYVVLQRKAALDDAASLRVVVNPNDLYLRLPSYPAMYTSMRTSFIDLFGWTGFVLLAAAVIVFAINKLVQRYSRVPGSSTMMQ